MKKHRLATRLWHWVNLLALAILFMSGLNISNAHPRLYWGDWGFESSEAWLHVMRFPGWATIPGHYSLAGARDWHLLFAWVFALALLLFMIASLLNRHFMRDLVTTRKEWRWSAIRADIVSHLKFDFSRGEGKYNFLQKLAYAIVVFILLPTMILTGMSISPGLEPLTDPLLALVGGRQSARSIHFITAWALFGFFLLHVTLVLLSGPLGQLRDMITGGPIDETA
ncbi:cytochrome b/b6 domain-containing protein [Croceibacterium aestuarii]|uniref:cytochrome b/b6 domain-containing protein n=1 Tax=Croceibacterium aestuarii TaxID=3064139 RepID=UPI00272DED77|nr:cytochrome b/b6 domain-containing protein [Croceibacterium sp. D39]